MSAILRIPDNLVGKYVHHRFDDSRLCNLFEDVKLQIIELIKSTFPESTVQIITKTFENDTIQMVRETLHDTIEITCVSDGGINFEFMVVSDTCDSECCTKIISIINNGLEIEQQSAGKCIMLYSHNLY